ncbi:unnamed protein product [Rodentolepis nana]|uniref:Secreted protein n=1 Tax=Rodentolepis nana TaxID=102285 RepID=A0A0R3TWC9_RODNA|nr:unnamed protein product [Rodentolepis nana]
MVSVSPPLRAASCAACLAFSTLSKITVNECGNGYFISYWTANR